MLIGVQAATTQAICSKSVLLMIWERQIVSQDAVSLETSVVAKDGLSWGVPLLGGAGEGSIYCGLSSELIASHSDCGVTVRCAFD